MKNVVYEEVLSQQLPSQAPPSHDNEYAEKESMPFFPPVQGLKRKSYEDQKTDLAPKRLEEVGFKTRPETPEDGNCLIHAVLDQMRFVIIHINLRILRILIKTCINFFLVWILNLKIWQKTWVFKNFVKQL